MTVTKMFNGSLFVTDIDGRYWNYWTEETQFKTYDEMKLKKKGYVEHLTNGRDGKLRRFEVTFKTNFKPNCQMEAEKLFGLGVSLR